MLMLEKETQDNENQSSQENAEDLYISYSVKVVESLEVIKKEYNEQNNSKVHLSKLKAVFKAAGENYNPTLDIEINTWCMARVNMYLDMAKGEKSYKKVEKQIFIDSDDLDLTESFIPTRECFEAAEKNVEEHDLSFDFEDIDNLYLTIEKEENRYGIIEP